MDAVLRVDGGETIGYGHLVRSGALAAELLACGHTISVVTTTPQPARAIFPAGVDIIELPTRGDPKPFVERLETVTPDVVFADAYPVDTEYQRAIRDRIPLAVLQDDARYAVCADLFVNRNLYASDLDYEFVGQKPEMCLGTDYVLLRNEIRNYAADEPPWRDQPERALVTMGGSDIANLTPTVVRAFDGLDIHVDAIVGPGCSESQERGIREGARASSAEVHVHRDPDDLAERMFQADFAVSTASSTTYELLALGTPIVSIPVADNQEPIASALRDREAATVLTQESEKGGFRNAIVEYMRNSELRRGRQSYGRELIDGRGTERVADAIAKVTS
jgi:UDP-2,4-diacetamido-2,4,6-trideoxy-beta-L-altropyranose hydrolase